MRRLLLVAGSGWAAASYFIPVLNWWRPYVAVTEAWDASDPDGGEPHLPVEVVRFAWAETRRRLLEVLPEATLRLGTSTRTLDAEGGGTVPTTVVDLSNGDVRISLVALAIQMVATVLTLIVVRRLSRRQDERFRPRVPTATAL